MKDQHETLKEFIKEVEARILDNSERDAKTVAELDELKRRFLLIFDRQQEVNIGKRNVNCMSCSEVPKNDTFTASDGKYYLNFVDELLSSTATKPKSINSKIVSQNLNRINS